MPPVLLNPSRFASGGGVSAGEAAFNAAQLAADSPLVGWKFDETSGTTAADFFGNGRNLTLAASISGGGGASLHSDNAGKSLALAQSGTQYGSIADAAWMNVSAITVELLANITGPVDGGNGDELIGRWFGSNWHIWRNTVGNFAVDLTNGSGATKTINSTTPLTSGTKYHLVMTKDDTDLRLYVNGSMVSSLAGNVGLGSGSTASGSPGSGIRTAASQIQVGRFLSTIGSIPAALYDSAAIYGAAHTSSAIAARYALI